MKTRAVIALALLATASGCMPKYVPPTAAEPHAIVKYRRSYEEPRGTEIREVLILNDELVFEKSDASNQATVARTDAFLVHPVPAHLKLRSIFSHQETSWVQESYSCGTKESPQTCYRTVSEEHTVINGSCNKELGVDIVQGENYLLQMSYQDSRNCSAHCFKQTPLGDGKFKNEPCDVVPIED